MGVIDVSLARVADLRDDAVRKSLGLSPGDLVSADYSMTQTAASRLRRARAQGVLAPSDAGEGHNLVVFEENLDGSCRVRVRSIEPVPPGGPVVDKGGGRK
jgi:hypothetical protein